MSRGASCSSGDVSRPHHQRWRSEAQGGSAAGGQPGAQPRAGTPPCPHTAHHPLPLCDLSACYSWHSSYINRFQSLFVRVLLPLLLISAYGATSFVVCSLFDRFLLPLLLISACGAGFWPSVHAILQVRGEAQALRAEMETQRNRATQLEQLFQQQVTTLFYVTFA